MFFYAFSLRFSLEKSDYSHDFWSVVCDTPELAEIIVLLGGGEIRRKGLPRDPARYIRSFDIISEVNCA